MWPLSIFLFVAAAAPQQKPLDVFQDFRHSEITHPCSTANPMMRQHAICSKRADAIRAIRCAAISSAARMVWRLCLQA